MPVRLFPLLALLCLDLVASTAQADADGELQAQVAARGEQVMGFSLGATTHVFTKTADGGVQQVLVRDGNDSEQIGLVRAHLRTVSEQFAKGDFSGPAQIHGETMPGLAEMAKARPGAIAFHYRELPTGAEIHYSTTSAALVTALHRWFDAQVKDHGEDARAGHQHPD